MNNKFHKYCVFFSSHYKHLVIDECDSYNIDCIKTSLRNCIYLANGHENYKKHNPDKYEKVIKDIHNNLFCSLTDELKSIADNFQLAGINAENIYKLINTTLYRAETYNSPEIALDLYNILIKFKDNHLHIINDLIKCIQQNEKFSTLSTAKLLARVKSNEMIEQKAEQKINKERVFIQIDALLKSDKIKEETQEAIISDFFNNNVEIIKESGFRTKKASGLLRGYQRWKKDNSSKEVKMPRGFEEEDFFMPQSIIEIANNWLSEPPGEAIYEFRPLDDPDFYRNQSKIMGEESPLRRRIERRKKNNNSDSTQEESK